MSIIRSQIAVWQDSLLPRDAFVITPHFRREFDVSDPVAGTQWQALADDLATGVHNQLPTYTQIEVKLYDAEAAPPSYPKARAIRNEGTVRTSLVPRELAVCLSYYADRNVPRQRGRLYMPYALFATSSDAGLRPPANIRTAVLPAFVGLFENLGGANVDWVVWSRLQQIARKVTNYWVDDEWDIMRKRGLRATTRNSGTTSG